MTTIQNQTFDQERALYGSRDLLVRNCSFNGPADGESAFKECAGIQVEHSFFNLRYPETSCQGLFNQIHKKATKKVPGSRF